MNPYFTLSAIFKLGLRGIERQMKLTTSPVNTFQDDPSQKEAGVQLLLAACLLINLTHASIRWSCCRVR